MGSSPVVNDETMAELVAKAVSDLFEPKDIIEDLSIPNMGGEDFANYLLEVPGAFFFLSSSNEKREQIFRITIQHLILMKM